MGYSYKNFDLISKAQKATGKDWKNIRVCELGRQLVKSGKSKGQTGKQYFEKLKVKEIVVIDLHDPGDYAVPLDLSEPIGDWENHFDLVTNCGTTEHIAQEGQEQTFQNIHNFTCVNGVMLHFVPTFPHGKIEYKMDFFKSLARWHAYRVVLLEHDSDKRYIRALFKKEKGN